MPTKIETALNIADLRELARKRLPRLAFDYIDGGAGDDITLARSESRYNDYELVWSALKDVREISTHTRIMGTQAKLPFFISPAAGNRLFHPRKGELATASAAHSSGVIYSCSTMASQTVEEIAMVNPGPKWVQVYVWKDRKLVENFLTRAKAAGFTGCILTVDVPVSGNRERDPRNKFGLPPKISPSLIKQVLARPGWLIDYLTTPAITASNFAGLAQNEGVMGFIDRQFSREVTWTDAKWMKDFWGDGFAIKGLSTADDARSAIDIGADAVWISNHGGRQLDTSVPTIDLLPDIAAAVKGQADIILDGGIRRGSHIAKALALGATGVAIGRAWLYGLGAGGEAGVARALTILETELIRTMALMGATHIEALTPDLVKVPH